MNEYRDLTFAFLGAACGIKLGIAIGKFLSRQRRGIVRYYTRTGGINLANKMGWYDE